MRTTADNVLNAAWIKVRTQENKSRNETAEGWNAAKAPFERADRELASARNKARFHGD